MRNWAKIIEVGDYDILVQRLCNNDDGEHVSITLKVDEGQLTTTMGFEDDSHEANEAFKNFKEEDAIKIVDSFEKLYKNDTQENNEKT